MVLSPECFYDPVMETLPNRELKNGNVAKFGQIVSGNGSGSVNHRSAHLAGFHTLPVVWKRCQMSLRIISLL
jgi:hypothetical protein